MLKNINLASSEKHRFALHTTPLKKESLGPENQLGSRRTARIITGLGHGAAPAFSKRAISGCNPPADAQVAKTKAHQTAPGGKHPAAAISGAAPCRPLWCGL